METIGGILMFKYILNYDGGFLRDSADLGYTYETGEEARDEPEMDMESRITDWEIDGCEYERELFEIIIEEV